ncbi:hypothetical protein AB6A40_007567 [Gnathostoma spinigerum]|uniref:C-type lectin domain-containing protein n=1 Tax=Gnathostoma spinigerum TaxID=75299 RepID=A0ABD6ELK9_9BILA
MNAGLVIVTSISLVIAGATGLSCTGGFVNNAVDSEYCFKIEGFDPKTHNEAVNDCFNQGSQLVAVTSKKDEQVVYSILHDNEDAKYCDDFWLAYDYDTDKEAYEWTAENVTLDQLAQQSIYGHSYGCISGKLKESGKWHIHSCIAKLCYICKKQMKFDIPTDHKPLEPVAKASPSCPKDSCRQKQRQSDAVHSRRDCLDLFEAGERK